MHGSGLGGDAQLRISNSAAPGSGMSAAVLAKGTRAPAEGANIFQPLKMSVSPSHSRAAAVAAVAWSHVRIWLPVRKEARRQ
jgi:hypothetical protein